MNKVPLDHLSYSSISSYLDCPANWYHKYIAKEPTMSSPALAFGSAFHETVEKLVTMEGYDESTIAGIWNKEWQKAVNRQEVFWGIDTPEEICNKGIQMFTNEAVLEMVKSIKPGQDEHGHKIERRVELNVPGVPVPIIGYIDIILDDGTPADFKTAARSWTQKKAEESLQSLFYLAAMNQMGIKVNWKFAHIVFVKTKTPKVQILEHSHKPGELFFLFELIQRVWDGISKGVFPMNPSTWKCNPKYCDFWSKCRGKYD